MAYLLVDKLDPNGLIGFTYGIDKFMHNLQIIGIDYYNSFMKALEEIDDEGLVEICACGRYLNIIQLSKDKTKGAMVFIDVQNDYNKALDAANLVKKSTKSGDYVKVFMEEFGKMSPYYQINYNAVELITGETALN